MPMLSGGKVIEGGAFPARDNTLVPLTVAQQGGTYTSPGLPAAGFLNAIAHPGSFCRRIDTGAIFVNTGTLAATVWTPV